MTPVIVVDPNSCLDVEDNGDIDVEDNGDIDAGGMMSRPSSTPSAHIPTTTRQISFDTSCTERKINDSDFVSFFDILGVDEIKRVCVVAQCLYTGNAHE